MSYFTFIESLDDAQRAILYGNLQTVEAIFRMLGPIQQQVLMRFMASPTITHSNVGILLGHDAKVNAIIQKLKKIGIVRHTKASDLLMDPVFKETLWKVISEPEALEKPYSTENEDEVYLKEGVVTAKVRWDAVLLFLLKHTEGVNGEKQQIEANLEPKVKELLLKCLLITPKKPQLTQKGWQFIFMDTSTQLWMLLKAYNELNEASENEQIGMINLLLKLTNLPKDKGFKLSALSKTERKLIKDFALLGLTYIMKEKDVYYATYLSTKLQVNKTEYSTTKNTLQDNTNKIILESNFHLYAYTSSAVIISTLKLFSFITSKFPNLVLSIITRQSILHLVSKGVSVSQLISYLTTNFHSNMATIQPTLVKTVLDQIHLWGSEINRLKSDPGTLYSDFATPQQYHHLKTYATELNILIYSNDDKQLLFLQSDSHTIITDFIKQIS